MWPHCFTNFRIQTYYQNEPIFNGVYSWDNLPNKIKDVAFATNLDKYDDIDTYWTALHVLNNDGTYFDSFAV